MIKDVLVCLEGSASSEAATHVAIDIPFRDLSGRERYHFACRGGMADDIAPDTPGINWVSPLMCTLAEGTKPLEESLLSDPLE